MEMHIICIFIFTALIFKRCSIHSWVETEARRSVCQLSKSLYRSSLFPVLALSISSHSVTSPSIFPLLCVVALCPISLHLSPSLSSTHSFFYFFINSLFCSFYCSSVSHFSLLSPQAFCCSSSSTVITAVLSAVFSATLCLPKVFQRSSNCEVLVF